MFIDLSFDENFIFIGHFYTIIGYSYTFLSLTVIGNPFTYSFGFTLWWNVGVPPILFFC